MDYSSTYIEKQLIGRGFYGRVYHVYHRKTNQQFVAKKIQFQGTTKEQKQSALKQVKIHQKLKHQNILEFKEFFIENEVLIMIMEYCQFGDLSVYIKKRKQKGQYFEEPLIVNLFVQLLFGLNYLHQNKILHRDIKTQNIFIDSEGTIKLADFGISKMLEHTNLLASTVVGTPYYLSPEACSNKGYNYKSDIWSLGCVLYELCTLEHPFNADNILLLAKKISTEEPKSIPSLYSSQLQKLIFWLLKKSPEQRPTIRQILQTKIISDYLIKFKMQDPVKQTPVYNPNKQFPIFETTCNLENEFLDIQYEKKQVHKIQTFQKQVKSPSKVNKIDEIKISPQKSRSQNLRIKCIEKMGSDLFNQIYNIMKSSQKKNMTQNQIQQILRSKYSKKEVLLSMDIAQLLYLEQMQGQ